MAGHRIYNTPLFQKIGIKQGMKFAAIDAPTWITEELKKQLLLPEVNIVCMTKCRFQAASLKRF